MMIKKDITTIEKGVIMHQVNCQNVMGAGVAKALYTKHPKVKAAFHQMAKKLTTAPLRNGLVWCNLSPLHLNSSFSTAIRSYILGEIKMSNILTNLS